MEKLLRTVTSSQDHYYNREKHTVVMPLVGSILSRTDVNTGETITYVVYQTRKKQRGFNKGIVDMVKLSPIIEDKDGYLYYERTNYPFILNLTNHGSWWNKELALMYTFNWNAQYPSPSKQLVRGPSEIAKFIEKSRNKSKQSEEPLPYLGESSPVFSVMRRKKVNIPDIVVEANVPSPRIISPLEKEILRLPSVAYAPPNT